MWLIHSSQLRPWLLTFALVTTVIRPASAVTLTDGPTAAAASTSTATITWSTDVAAGSKVSYGISMTAMTQKAEGGVTASHSVTLSDLQSGTTYYYEVGSARVKLGTGSFTTTGPSAPGSKAAPDETRKSPPTTRAPPAALKAPATRATWASVASLPDHFARHGGDFNARSTDDYAAQAWQFLQRARQESLPMKWDDSDSTLRVWDPGKHIFAAYNQAGKTRTFFKPGNPEYWSKQPGRAIRPGELPF